MLSGYSTRGVPTGLESPGALVLGLGRMPISCPRNPKAAVGLGWRCGLLGGRGSTLKTAGTRTLQAGAAHGPPSPRVGSPPGAPGHWGAQVWRQAAPQDARWWCQPPEVLGGDLVMSEAGTGRGRPGVVWKDVFCVSECAHLRCILRP